MPEQPEQPEHSSRFRAGDIQMRAMSSFASLDDLTVYVEYLLSRFDAQAAQLKAKAALYKKLGPDLRARALRAPPAAAHHAPHPGPGRCIDRPNISIDNNTAAMCRHIPLMPSHQVP